MNYLWSLEPVCFNCQSSSKSWALSEIHSNQVQEFVTLLQQSRALSRMNFPVKDFGYSTKNIPLASKSSFLQNLIGKTESLIHRMRWKALFFLRNQNSDHDDINKETYGFKSKRPPPHVSELSQFEDCMLEMIQRIEFSTNHTRNKFQEQLNKDMQEIRQDKHIFVKADKTTNHYKTEPNDYLNLVQKNVTKAYKKTNQSIPNTITLADQKIAQSLALDDRIEISARRDAFITLKDHKPDFTSNPSADSLTPPNQKSA